MFKNYLLKAVDLVISVLVFLVETFRPKRVPNTQSPRILICRLDHIGDVVMTTPSVRAIKEKYPNSDIYLLINKASAGVFKNNPFISDCLYFNWPFPFDSSNNKFTYNHVKEYYKLYKKIKSFSFDIMIEFRGDLRMFFLFGFMPAIPIIVGSPRRGGEAFLTNSIFYDKSHHELERVEDILHGINIFVNKKRGDFFITNEDLTRSIQIQKEVLGNYELSKYLVICPFAAKNVKEWLPENWSAISYFVANNLSIQVFIVGTNANIEIAEFIVKNASHDQVFNLCGKTSIIELAAIMQRSEIVIGVDSGSLHIASCFDVPIISLFGPTRSHEFHPYTPYGTIIDMDVCVCNKDLHLYCNRKVNNIPYCMHSISNEIVSQKIIEILENNKKAQ
jgi:ADP-heptose:LPS heptosyltransferase